MRALNLLKLLVLALIFCNMSSCPPEERFPTFELNPVGLYTFEAKEVGYDPITPLTVTVTNTGNLATGNLTIALEGANSGDFELSKYSIPSLNPGQNATFTVAPVSGLGKATYQAVVSVFAGADVRSCNITFVVTNFCSTKLEILSLPTQLNYGLGEPFNPAGMKVKTSNCDGQVFELPLLDEYFSYNFSILGTATVSLSAGGKTITDITQYKDSDGNPTSFPGTEIKVRSLIARMYDFINKNTTGVPDTVYVYTSERIITTEADVFNVNTNNRIEMKAGTNLVLTTHPSVEEPCIIKKKDQGGLVFRLYGPNCHFILDGRVTIEGFSNADYGGADEVNNNNQIVWMDTGSKMTMKGNSKITGNTYRKTTDENLQGGTLNVDNAEFIMEGHSSITHCKLVHNNSAYPTRVPYGGVFMLKGSTGKFTIRENASITDNQVISETGNAYGGVGYTEALCEISVQDNALIARNGAISKVGVAGGGAFMMIVSSPLRISGGKFQDNYVTFKTGAGESRGGAIGVGSGSGSGMCYLSGTVNIPQGTGGITTASGLTTDARNSIGLYTGNAIRIDVREGSFNAVSPIFLDLTQNFATTTSPFVFTTPVIGKISVEGVNSVVDFAGTFVLGYLINLAQPFSRIPLTDYEINGNGYVVPK